MDLIGSKITNAFVDTSKKISNKHALKLLGLNISQVSESELLHDLSSYIEPVSINALMADDFNSCFILFLNDVESVCKLIQTKIQLLGTQVKILPLVETFVIHSVYPFISNDLLTEIFRPFGTVLEIHKLSVAPNSSLFSHVLSSKCEISFLLPRMEAELHLPEHIQHPPFKFSVKKLCCACSTEGHSLLHCPDIDCDFDVRQKHLKTETETEFILSTSTISCPTSVQNPKENQNSPQEINFSDFKQEMLELGVQSSCGSSDSSASSSSEPLQDCCRKRLKKLKQNLKRLSERRAKKNARKKLKKTSPSKVTIDVKVED